MFDEYFSDYNDVLYQIKENQDKLEIINNEIYGIKGISFNDMPKGTPNGDLLVIKIQQKDDLIKKINELLRKKDGLYELYCKDIDEVSDHRYKSILRRYYLDKQKMYQIARYLGLSTSHVMRLKREADDEFKMIVNNSK